MSVQYWNQRFLWSILCTFQLWVCTDNWNAQLRVTSCFSFWISWSLNVELISSSETSVRNSHDTVRNIPEELISLLFHRTSLKSCLIVPSYSRLYQIFSGMIWLKHIYIYIFMYCIHIHTPMCVCVCVCMRALACVHVLSVDFLIIVHKAVSFHTNRCYMAIVLDIWIFISVRVSCYQRPVSRVCHLLREHWPGGVQHLCTKVWNCSRDTRILRRRSKSEVHLSYM